MPFADSAKAQDKSTPLDRCAGLIGMANDARIEQRRRLERILVQKICADETALRLIQFGMRFKRFFHLGGARLEDVEQVPVTTVEIFEYVAQLLPSGLRFEPENPADDMIRADLIGRIEVPRLRRRLERPDDDPGRVGPQI